MPRSPEVRFFPGTTGLMALSFIVEIHASQSCLVIYPRYSATDRCPPQSRADGRVFTYLGDGVGWGRRGCLAVGLEHLFLCPNGQLGFSVFPPFKPVRLLKQLIKLIKLKEEKGYFMYWSSLLQ